jgi:uncharacterized protein YjiK
MTSDELGVSNISGLAFSYQTDAFIFITYQSKTYTEVSLFNSSGDPIGNFRVNMSLSNPLNMTFDNYTKSLLYHARQNRLLEFKFDNISEDNFSTERFESGVLNQLDVSSAQGITVDPEKGDRYYLDGQLPLILHLGHQSYNGRERQFESNIPDISEIHLNSLSGLKLQGIAYNSLNKHLYIYSPSNHNLYEVDDKGEIVSIRDLSLMGVSKLLGMVFAPSGDRTDDPANTSLYIAEGSLNAGKGGIIELSLIKPLTIDRSEITVSVSAYRSKSLNPKNRIMKSKDDQPSDPTIDAFEVNTIFTSSWVPPSPDPAGAAYFSGSNTLLIADSEVNEMPIYADVNIFESTFSGTVVETSNTLSFSNEPTGIAYNPANGHFFISDDNADEVFEIDAGNDGIIGTADDNITSFDTRIFSSEDPEGIAFDTWQGHLFVVDGVNTQVYEIDPGNNGIFDGPPSDGDDVISQFDTNILGLTDPEGIEFNPDNGTLYIVSGDEDFIMETDRDGNAVRSIDITFLNARTPAGLAYAPSSTTPGENSLYIVDRGVDNDTNPLENDGKIYEITDEDISLPVELSSFTADLFGNHIWLEWTTESELENIGFEIYRSEKENGNYSIISSYIDNDELEGLGNSSTGHRYSYLDDSVIPGQTYWYKLADQDIHGISTFHGPVSISINLNTNQPSVFQVFPNYPNPFNPSTSIRYQLPVHSDVEISIFNNLGREIVTLVSEAQSAGHHQVEWDASGYASGIYYYVIKANSYQDVKKMVLIK